MLRRFAPQTLRTKSVVKSNRRLFLESLEGRDLLAGVTTDKLDYSPASTALITATGYQVGERVQFQVVHIDGTPNTGNGHEPWVVQDGSAQDLDGLRDGNVKTSWYVDPDDSLGATFELSALGLSSGVYDTHIFTDAIKVDLDQWANDDVSWQNGNINENNATYAEGDTVPFHYVISGLTGGQSYSIGIEWDTTENSGAHAYDYITDYNESESDPPTNPLVDTAGNVIPNVPAGTDLFPIPIDTRVTNGPDALSGTADDIVQLPGSFKVYGGDMTAVSGYTLTGTYTTGIGYVGATKTSIVITFTAGGVGNNVTTVIAWGGHISSKTQWQPEPTASNISGSPYHMRSGDTLFNNTTQDSQNLGQQDRSLSAAAVITPATITVIKDAAPNDPQDFAFTTTGTGLTNFTLDDDGTNANPLSNTQVFTFTEFGTKTITEALVAGWTLTGVEITESGTQDSTFSLGSRLATLNVQEGEAITVKFTNTKAGGITVVKDAQPNSAQDFSFSGTLGAFLLDDDADGTLPNSQNFSNLAPGSYTLTEAALAGWDLTNLVINDPDGGSSVNLATRTATIDVDAGEAITVTFTNTQRGSISVVKDAVPNSPQDFTFFSEALGGFFLDDDADPTLANTRNFANLTPGIYTITELGLAGWDLTNLVINDPDGGSSVNLATRTATIDLDAGEAITVTYTNTQQGGITVVKDAAPNSPQDFSFSGSLGAFLLDDDADPTLPSSRLFGNLAPGVYTVTEAQIANWDLLELVINDPDGGSSIDLANRTATIDLDPGEAITVTFTNCLRGSIDVVKDAQPNSAQDFSFSGSFGAFLLDDDADPTLQNHRLFGDLTRGTYTITEAALGGWDLTNLVINDPDGGSSVDLVSRTATIDLDSGEAITVTFTNTQQGNITVVKDAQPNSAQDFSFSGTLGAFLLDDDADGTLANSLNFGNLIPGTYTVTEAALAGWNLTNLVINDPDGGSSINLATRTATIDVDAGEAITVTFTNTQQGGITVVKDAQPNSAQDFSFTGTLGAFLLDDDADGTLPSSLNFGNLVPGTYTITEAALAGWDLTNLVINDPDGGSSVNLATGTATIDVDAGEAITVTFTNTQRGTILVEKQTNPDGSFETFEFDPSYAGANFFLADGQQNNGGFLVPGSYTVQELAEAGWNLTNIEIVSGDTDNGSTTNVGALTATLDLDAGELITVRFTNTQQNPALNILKDATVPGGTADIAGEVISYAIAVQNTGNQTLTGVTVVDPFVSNLTRIADLVGDNDNLLEVGETWRYTASHVVTQAEIDAGTNIVNVATADSNETPPDSDDGTVPVTQAPALNILKDATVPGGTANVVGEVISYSISVQNTSNQTLTGVTVVDPFVSNLTRIADLVGDNDNLLEVGETWRFTASHIVTQAEIDAGTNIVNIATADSNETPPDTDDASIPVTQNPALNIIKDATVPGGTADFAGEVVSYTIQVQNTGNQTLTGVTVVDPFVSNLTRIADLVGDNDNLLEVGETWRFTASHIVTQAEIDAGTNIVNIATADSTQTPPDTDDASVPVTQNPALNILKDATVPGGTADIAGEVISYTIQVQNTGNQTLTGATVVDPFVSNLTRIADLVGDNDNLLEVGETWRFTASHIVTQAEINAGTNIVNIATADSNETPPDNDDASVPVGQTAALNIIKDATVPGGTANFAGEVISYAIQVQNTGNQTLTSVTVVDPFVSNLTRIADLFGDNDNLLEVGETWRFTASHIVTQAEIDAGTNVVNIATADSNETPPDTDDASVPVTQNPALNIIKDATVPGGTADFAGEVVSYTIQVQNTGNQTLTGVTVVDPFVSNLTRIADLVGDNDNLLEVGETWRYTASHVVTQAEIDAGTNIVNVATADSNQTPPDNDDATVPVVRRPGVSIVKDATVPGGTADVAGEVITYTIVIQNTGNMTLTGERVDDPRVNNLTRNADLVGDNDNLFEVGEIWSFTATHIVTQAEIDAGINIDNVATVTSNQTTPTSDDATIPVTQAPALNLAKFTNGEDANTAPGPILRVGSAAIFTYTVNNTGNVALGSVVLSDDNGTPGNLADDFNPTFTGGDGNSNGLLDVGETWTYIANRIVTEGQYTNLGTVSATTLTGVTATDSDPSSHFGRRGAVVVTPDKGNRSLPYVHIVDADTGEIITRFQAYEDSYLGGVRVATGDLNGDGIDEIITAPGRNRMGQVKVFDQQGNFLYAFNAFPASFKGGVEVAVGDVNGDGRNDIITSMSYGGNQVKVFKNNSAYGNLAFSSFSTFNAFGTSFKGGASVKAASLGTAVTQGGVKKLNGYVDGKAEIIVASGSGMRATVKVFTFFGANKVPTVVRTFQPLGSTFRGGITMDVARVNADAIPDIIVAAGNGGGSQVQVLNGSNGSMLLGFAAYTAADGSHNAPVHVAAQDSDGDGIADVILTAQGTDGATRKIRKFTALSPQLVDEVMEQSNDFFGAYYLETLDQGSLFGNNA